MQITEKDLFDFSFHRATLTWPKIKFILNDPFLMNYVRCYSDLKNDLDNSDLPDRLKIKLAKKIHAYNLENQYLLEPVKKFQSKLNFNLYSNISREFFAKELHNSENSRVYFFSAYHHVLENIEVTLKPHNKIFELKNNKNPLIFEKDLEFDSFIVRFAHSISS